MPFDVRRVANAILAMAEAEGRLLTNMALNKLTFFSHGWHLAVEGSALVDSPFEAWQHGPVHPVLYRQFKCYGAEAITTRATRVDLATGGQIEVDDTLPDPELAHCKRIFDFYGGMSASKLSQISHEIGAPWDQVWSREGSTPGMSIPDLVTSEYYKSKLRRTH